MEKIEKKISEIFLNQMFRDLSKAENIWKESIFGQVISLLPAEAYYLLTVIEKEFDIEYPVHLIFENKFNILGDIVKQIDLCLKEKHNDESAILLSGERS